MKDKNLSEKSKQQQTNEQIQLDRCRKTERKVYIDVPCQYNIIGIWI